MFSHTEMMNDQDVLGVVGDGDDGHQWLYSNIENIINFFSSVLSLVLIFFQSSTFWHSLELIVNFAQSNKLKNATDSMVGVFLLAMLMMMMMPM